MATKEAATRDVTNAADLELTITRVFAAPRELVFEAWTKPEHLNQWCAPKGFTIPFSEGEVRVGGRFRTCMRSPDGKDYWLHGVYRELVAPERLVFTHEWEADNAHETLVTVTFAARDGKTEMTFRQAAFKSVESRHGHSEGWTECFERLDDYVRGLQQRGGES